MSKDTYMKYIKPEIKDIELLDPKTFVSCSPTDIEIPEEGDDQSYDIPTDKPGWDER